MADIKVVMDIPGCIALRNSPGVQAYVLSIAQRTAARASGFGGSYNADVRPGKTRAQGRAAATDKEAYMANLKDNALLKSL
jgi:hypothetical protein